VQQKHLFFDTQSYDQSILVQQILENYRNNSLLARSILSGPNLHDKEKFEEDIWFDLDQTRRQAKIHGKSYRDIALYVSILQPLQAAHKEIQDGIEKYKKALELASRFSWDLFTQKTCVETISNELDEIFPGKEDSDLKQMIKDYTLLESDYLTLLDQDDDLISPDRNYQPPHQTKWKSWCIDKRTSFETGKSKIFILKKHGINEHFYQTCMHKMNEIQQQGKDKQIVFDDKLLAQQQIREYLQYRVTKNQIHTLLNTFFPQHKRKNSIDYTPIRTDYMYVTGYQLSQSEHSVVKTGLPSIPVEHEQYNPRNRVTGNVDKVIATPGSWTYIYSDIPINLFAGRKGDIAFTLIGLDENLIAIFNSHHDLSSTSSKSIGLQPHNPAPSYLQTPPINH